MVGRAARHAAGVLLALAVVAVSADEARAGATSAPDGLVRGDWVVDPGRALGVTAAVRDVTGEVRDVVVTVETTDGSFGVAQGGPTTTVTVRADVLFAFDRADLSPAARAKLGDVARELRERGARGSVTVGGHADSRGDSRYNQVLSERRARAVAAALQPLVRDLGVALIPQGFGDTRPVAPNARADGADDPAGRARNRRVTIAFDAP
jgi:outer membrane protein OmpA-like peptidoglycan-associated protein